MWFNDCYSSKIIVAKNSMRSEPFLFDFSSFRNILRTLRENMDRIVLIAAPLFFSPFIFFKKVSWVVKDNVWKFPTLVQIQSTSSFGSNWIKLRSELLVFFDHFKLIVFFFWSDVLSAGAQLRLRRLRDGVILGDGSAATGCDGAHSDGRLPLFRHHEVGRSRQELPPGYSNLTILVSHRNPLLNLFWSFYGGCVEHRCAFRKTSKNKINFIEGIMVVSGIIEDIMVVLVRLSDIGSSVWPPFQKDLP